MKMLNCAQFDKSEVKSERVARASREETGSSVSFGYQITLKGHEFKEQWNLMEQHVRCANTHSVNFYIRWCSDYGIPNEVAFESEGTTIRIEANQQAG